jgi:hypothetical protein
MRVCWGACRAIALAEQGEPIPTADLQALTKGVSGCGSTSAISRSPSSRAGRSPSPHPPGREPSENDGAGPPPARRHARPAVRAGPSRQRATRSRRAAGAEPHRNCGRVESRCGAVEQEIHHATTIASPPRRRGLQGARGGEHMRYDLGGGKAAVVGALLGLLALAAPVAALDVTGCANFSASTRPALTSRTTSRSPLRAAPVSPFPGTPQSA